MCIKLDAYHIPLMLSLVPILICHVLNASFPNQAGFSLHTRVVQSYARIEYK